jgi:Xaa-Pro aminopeptidase
MGIRERFPVTAAEADEKARRIREFLAARGLAGLLISGRHVFSWATCGRENRVPRGSDIGAAHALFTADGGKFLLCDNIEEPRLRDEEQLEAQGFTFIARPWTLFSPAAEVKALLGEGASWGADTPQPGATLLTGKDLAPLRYSLTSAEIERYRWLGQTAAQALETTANALEPGMTEFEAAALLNHLLEDEGVLPHLTLVASDERLAKYRHPLPTEKTIETSVMLVTGATAFGLICCATRLVHFGPVPGDLKRRHEAVCQVDAALNLSTVPGVSVGEIFRRGQDAYARVGFPDEWTFHHQGGATGYTGRDYRATPETTETVQPFQAFAWNPSIAGTKSEDTILATPDGPDVLSPVSAEWPTLRVETAYGMMERPLILER